MARKDQSQRFKDTAKRLGADESGETFERAFKKLVPPKAGIKKRPRKRKKSGVS